MFTSRHLTRQLVSIAATLTLIAGSAIMLVGCPPGPPPPPPVVDPPPVVIPSLAPGLVIVVEEITFPEDLLPEVVFSIEDDKGNPVNVKELSDARFILGYLETPATGSTARFISYITSTEDPDGTPGSGDEATQATYDGARLNGITDNEDGTYTYKFATSVPANFDAGATHQLAGQFRRTFVVDGQSYPYNLVEPFVPDGSEAKQVNTREIVLTERCNECHTRLGLHGGIRREVQLCIMCHSTVSADAQSGNTVDMPELIHKIHRGADLPSVQDGEPYQIVGSNNSVHDYSDVIFPQDIRNCAVCHNGGEQSDFYRTKPTLAGCASCHDRTWFGSQDTVPAGWEMHVGGSHQNDALCAQCHTPTAPGPSPVLEAHIIPTESDQAPGLAMEVLDVQIIPAKQGGNGQVMLTFSATDKTGAISDLSVLDRVAATIGWPAPDYQATISENLLAAGNSPGTLVNNGNGTYNYTFASTEIPTDSGYTLAAALEGRRFFAFRGEDFTQGTSSNGLLYFTTDGSEPEMRRTVVDQEKCAKCHKEVRAHSNRRVGVEYCVMCHNPNKTDIARRPVEELPAATLNYKDMIHKIHRGEDLEGPYTTWASSPHVFTGTRVPGLIQECSICHEGGTEQLPLPDGLLSTLVTDGQGGIISDMLPQAAACTSCHDGVINIFHAQLQSDLNARVESCAVCHGPGEAFAVDAVHALEP